MNCKNCKFYNEEEETDVQSEDGICTRYPPRSEFMGEDFISYFPKVKGSWRCGEFITNQTTEIKND